MERVALGKTRIYELMAAGEFPMRILIGSCARWHAGDVLAWIDGKRTANSNRLGVPTVPARGDATDVEEQ
jgi:predicted DNA-binding transcriptional regulator AlpA